MMKLEVLISAMNQTDMTISSKTFCNTDVLIINQTNYERYEEAIVNGHKVRMYSTIQRGLSRSRNMALVHAAGDICLFCDDDEELVENYSDIILKAFEHNTNADIISFDVSINKENRRYRKSFNYGKRKMTKKVAHFKGYGSCSIAFRRENILKANLWFDVRFGAGSGLISAGEESVWQFLSRRKGLIHLYHPELIASIKQTESTWFEGLNEKYFYDLGACLSVNFPFLCYFLKYYYIFFIHGGDLSKYNRLRYLKAGIKMFKKSQIGFEQFLVYCREK